MVGHADRESARFGDFTAAREYLPALRFRSLGGRLAQERAQGDVLSSAMRMTSSWYSSIRPKPIVS